MTDTLGEDRLLEEVEAALQKATPGPWMRGSRHGTYCTEITSADGGREIAAVWNYADAFAAGELRPVQQLSAQGEADFALMQHAPEWLGALVQAVEDLREKLGRANEQNQYCHDNHSPGQQMVIESQTQQLHDERAEVSRLRADGQRLRALLEKIAAKHEGCDDGFYACPKSEDYFGSYTEDETPIENRPCYCWADQARAALAGGDAP